MTISSATAQIRTTDLDASIDFYVSKLGFALEFRFSDFYAGIRIADGHSIHLKLVDQRDPSIDFVRDGGHLHLYFSTEDADGAAERFRRNGVTLQTDVVDTAWGTREFYVLDNEGHSLCFAESAQTAKPG